MSNSRVNTFTSLLTTSLLLFQVILSLVLITRLSALDEKVNTSLTLADQQSGQPQPPRYVQNISIGDMPIRGNMDAPVTIVEFSDYECPFCAQATSILDSTLENYKGRVRLAYRDYPLMDRHPNAFKAAQAARCANEQGKFWEMHDVLFKNQNKLGADSLKKYAADLGLNMSLFSECLDTSRQAEQVQQDMTDASAYQVSATPTFFVNGYRVIGAAPEMLKQMIDQALQQKEGN